MRRSAFRLLLLVAAVALGAVHARATAAGPRIGFLSPGTPEGTASVTEGLSPIGTTAASARLCTVAMSDTIVHF